MTRAFAAGAFRDGNTRHGGIGISAARPGGVNEDAFFTQGAALFCDKCPAAVAREFAEETLHVHNATTREPVWTSTGVSGERVAKVLFPRRRAWGFHKNWNYGKHAARRRAWEKAGGGPAPLPYDPDIATCAANRALARLHVAPAPHGGGPATEATYCGKRPGWRCRGHGRERRCHPDASCDPRALPVPPSREDTSSTTSKS